MQKILFILYVLYEFAQIAAVTLGLERYFQLEMIFAAPAGVIISLVPVIGTGAAIVAAMYVWELHWMVATSAFVLPGLFILTLAMLGEVSETRSQKNNGTQHNGLPDHPPRRKLVKKKVDDF